MHEQPTEEPGDSIPETSPTVDGRPWWRRVLPFFIAGGLVAFVLQGIDWPAFAQAFANLNHALFVGAAALFTLALLTADTLATVVIYRWTIAPVAYRVFFALRGASYLPSLLNHHVGQGVLTYFLARIYRVSLARVAGATLVGYAAWAGCILGFGSLALFAAGHRLWLVLVVGAGLAYLLLLHLRPAALVRRSLLAPLFDVGVSGHLVALAARIPHFVVMFVGTWLPFWLFDVRIPLADAALYLPVLMVLVTLPITPQGIGTRDAFAAAVLAPFATAATEEARLAQLAAATLSWGVTLTLVELVIGVLFWVRVMPRLRRAAG